MAPLSLKIVLDNGAVTRKVKFDSRATVREALVIVKEKVIVPEGKEYALFLRSADDDMSGVWLDPNRPLEYYMLRDGDSLDYMCRNRNLRVKLLDGSVKTLQVDEAKPVGELMMIICSRIGITNYDEYGLCHEVDEDEDTKLKEAHTGTLTLKRKHVPKERDPELEQLSKKLKTDDYEDWLDQHCTLRELGVDPNETLLLKRRLFYTDRNVDSRDPVQLNLLYVQTRDAILNGRHLVTEQQAHDCKVRWINIRDVHRRILRKSLNPQTRPKPYKYESEMKFMRSYYKDVQLVEVELENNEYEEEAEDRPVPWTDLMSEGNDDQDMPEASYSDECQKPLKELKPKKRKYKKKRALYVKEEKTDNIKTSTSLNETSPTEFDPTDTVDAFLLSIGATLKTFSPYHLNVAKTKIFGIVQEHDLQQIVEKQQNDPEVKVTVSTAVYDL